MKYSNWFLIRKASWQSLFLKKKKKNQGWVPGKPILESFPLKNLKPNRNMRVSHCAGSSLVVSAWSPPFSALFCEAGAGTLGNPSPRSPHVSVSWFLAGGDTGGRLTCRSKGEKGLGCFQLLSAFLPWPVIALVHSFFRNFWHPFAVVPARFQASVILCVSCSPHPASSVFDCIDYFWLCWVFAASRGLSLVAVWASRCRGFSLCRAQPLEWGFGSCGARA